MSRLLIGPRTRQEGGFSLPFPLVFLDYDAKGKRTVTVRTPIAHCRFISRTTEHLHYASLEAVSLSSLADRIG